MNPAILKEYLNYYRSSLLNDTEPFWSSRCLDKVYGGFLTYFDQKGVLLSSEKNGWVQGRMTWMYMGPGKNDLDVCPFI